MAGQWRAVARHDGGKVENPVTIWVCVWVQRRKGCEARIKKGNGEREWKKVDAKENVGW